MQIFVSYASRDADFARLLLRELRRHNFHVWDAWEPAQRIVFGEDIARALRDRIDQANLELGAVLAIISAESLASPWTRAEVQHALDRGFLDRNALIGITLPDCGSGWAPPFSSLEKTLLVRVTDFTPEQQVRRVLLALLFRFGLEHRSSAPVDERLPLAIRVQREIIRGRVRIDVVDTWTFNQIMDLALRAEEAYARHAWREALAAARSVTDGLNDVLSRQGGPYYARIVEACCLFEQGQIDAAEELFQELCEHPQADQDAPTGVGHCRFKHDDYQSAIECYERALRLDRSGDTTVTRMNLDIARFCHSNREARAHSDGRAPVDIRAMLDLARFAPDERARVARFWASSLEARGQLVDALIVLRMLTPSEDDAASLVYRWKVELSIAPRRAMEALRSLMSGSFSSHTLVGDFCGALLMATGQFREAATHYRQLAISHGEQALRYEGRRLIILWNSGIRDRAVREAQALLEEYRRRNSRFFRRSGQTPEDRYWEGLLLYVIGASEAARHSFTQSFDWDVWYDQCLSPVTLCRSPR